MQMAARLGRSSPDPGFGPMVELHRRHLHRSFNLISVGETLPSERIATEETPPPFLEVEPSRAPLGMKRCWMRGCCASQVRVPRLL